MPMWISSAPLCGRVGWGRATHPGGVTIGRIGSRPRGAAWTPQGNFRNISPSRVIFTLVLLVACGCGELAFLVGRGCSLLSV